MLARMRSLARIAPLAAVVGLGGLGSLGSPGCGPGSGEDFDIDPAATAHTLTGVAVAA